MAGMPESRFYAAYIALTLAAVVSVPGCTRRGDPRGDAAATEAKAQQEVPAVTSSGGLPYGWWEARSELPAQNGAGLFQGREPKAPLQRPPSPVRPAATIPQGPSGPPPPPLIYVGKVARDGEGYAVLVRDERVYMVAVGDAVGNGYRVQSISEKEVVIQNVDFGMRQTLPFSAAAPNAVLPAGNTEAPSPSEPPAATDPPADG
jgi:hypothetical protein